MSDRLIAISPGTDEWNAWLKHHRGTKQELMMLSCARQCRTFYALSKFPPDAPRLSAPAPRVEQKPEIVFAALDCRSHEIDALIDEAIERMSERGELRAAETAEQKKRRKLLGKAERAHDQAMLAPLENRRPIVEGVDDLDVVRVEDPSEAEELVSIGKGPPMRLRKTARPRYRVVSLRSDPIGQLAKRGLLGQDEVRDDRLAAARRYQVYYELAEIGGARAMDPCKELIDGGTFTAPDADRHLQAQRRRAELRDVLGFIPELRITRMRLLDWVLGEKRRLVKEPGHETDSIDQRSVAEILGMELDLSPREKKRLSLARHINECLDVLAVAFGVVTDPTDRRRRRRDDYDREAQLLDKHAKNPILQAALHRAMKLRESECSPGT
jgi:hypothetical protein